MKNKTGLLLALAAAVLSLVSPNPKKEVLKTITPTSIITNIR